MVLFTLFKEQGWGGGLREVKIKKPIIVVLNT